MMAGTRASCVSLAVILIMAVQQLWTGQPHTLEAQTLDGVTSVSLVADVNNAGIDSGPGTAGFDGAGDAYPAAMFPPDGHLVSPGISFQLARGSRDNVVALGQTIHLTAGRYTSANFLIASSFGETTGAVTVHYADGSDTQAPLDAPDWSQVRESPVLSSATRLGPQGVQGLEAGVFVEQAWMDHARVATSITLPVTRVPALHVSSMHIFALSLVRAVSGDSMSVLGARSTTKLMADGSQVVEAVLENTGTVDHTAHNPVKVSVEGNGIDSTVPARVTRLPAGEELAIEVGIKPSVDVPVGSTVAAELIARSGDSVLGTEAVPLAVGVARFAATQSSLSAHEAPDWFDGAKFGIFIHYGLYSIPAWAPVGGVYAEWYWHSMEQKGSETYRHQLAMYGSHFQYDDFIPRFTADKFDPKAWVELFKRAGARYFVMVAKHHDGFALFHTRFSRRNSLVMGPHRDLVGEVFAAARRYTPRIHPGVYYSLPEWFNPAYPGIEGKNNSFAGGPPHDYVTGQVIPYTGYVPVSSYVRDYQVPQMMELIDQYHPDMLWCDIGGDNDSLQVLAHLYDDALATHRQVAVNNRCGVAVHDYTTPEYRVYAMTVHAKWETSRGLDPHSYGYNTNTPLSAYASAGSLVRELVDVVSKNGNLLLDIGPRGDGSIPQVMQDRLRQIGSWLAVNGEAIYNTNYWWRAPADGNLRFTLRPNRAFYIISLARPGSHVMVHAPVPLLTGDRITLLGWHGGPLHWERTAGVLAIDVPSTAQRSGKYAWVFKIS